VLVVDLAAPGAQVVDGVVHVLGVPEHEDVEREAERHELVFLALAVRLAQLAAVAVEDDARDGVAALVAVDMHADGAPVGVAVDVVQEVQRLGGAAELGDRAPQRRRAPAALQDAQQLARAHRAGGERSEDAQDVVPVRDDQLGVDAVAREAVQCAVVGVAVQAPEALVGQAGGRGLNW